MIVIFIEFFFACAFQGAFGEVRRCVHKQTNLTRAVKIISKMNTPKSELDRLKTEVEILKSLVTKKTKNKDKNSLSII